MTDTYSAIQATMLNDVNRLSIVSQNLANATTAGYKKQVAVSKSFSQYMPYQTTDGMDETVNNYARYSLPYLDSVNDPSMGTVKYTGSSLDLVANGNTYFTIRTPQGVAYTKQGSFNRNASGVIVNPQGYPLMGEGGEIYINNDDPVIDDRGNVLVNGQTLDKLKTVTFRPGSPLTPIGFGLYVNNGEAVEVTAGNAKIKQGYQEMSNVVVMEEMVKMIEIMRHFEAAQKYMQGYDDMLDNAINVIGEL